MPVTLDGAAKSHTVKWHFDTEVYWHQHYNLGVEGFPEIGDRSLGIGSSVYPDGVRFSPLCFYSQDSPLAASITSFSIVQRPLIVTEAGINIEVIR